MAFFGLNAGIDFFYKKETLKYAMTDVRCQEENSKYADIKENEVGSLIKVSGHNDVIAVN